MTTPDTSTPSARHPSGTSHALDAYTDKAQRINAAHREAKEHAARAIERAIEAGDLLNEVKASLPHGQWLPWLSQHCPDISARTAQSYMRVARELPTEKRSAADLSVREALRQLEAPSEHKPEPGESERIALHMEKQPIFDSDIAPAIWLADAAGWDSDRTAQVIDDNNARFGFGYRPICAADVTAALGPAPIERSNMLSSSDPEPEAERLYAPAQAWTTASIQSAAISNAQLWALGIGCTETAARLQSVHRVIERRKKPPRAPSTLLEQACIAAGELDGIHAYHRQTPWDRGALPVGYYSVATLHGMMSESLDPSIEPYSRMIIRRLTIATKDVEAMPLFQAWEVLSDYLSAKYGRLEVAA